MILEILFWILLAPVVWCYVGYPLVMVVLARVRVRHAAASRVPSLPTVTVVIAVRNERGHLARRVENILTQDYPPDRLDMVVVCNGSVDGSEDIARAFAAANPRIDARLHLNA